MTPAAPARAHRVVRADARRPAPAMPPAPRPQRRARPAPGIRPGWIPGRSLTRCHTSSLAPRHLGGRPRRSRFADLPWKRRDPRAGVPCRVLLPPDAGRRIVAIEGSEALEPGLVGQQAPQLTFPDGFTHAVLRLRPVDQTRWVVVATCAPFSVARTVRRAPFATFSRP